MARDKSYRRLTQPIATPALIALAAALAAVVAATPAWAGKKEDAESAREHTRRATAAYNLGHFDEAVTEYEAAYKLTLDPAMLFNVAQSQRLGGHLDRALATYKAYLRTAPRGARGRQQAEKWREELERGQGTPPAPAGGARADAAGAPPVERTPAPFVPPPAAPSAPAPAPVPPPPPPPPPQPPPAARAPEPPPPVAPASEIRTVPTSAPAPASSTSAAPAAPPAGEPAGTVVERPPDGGAAPLPGPDIVEIDLGPRFLSRSFQYTPSDGAPSGYRLSITPVIGGRLSLFPFARSTGFYRQLGLLAVVEAATWMRSGVFPTGTSDLLIGIQARLPAVFGQVSGSVAYFRHAFVLQDSPDPLDQRRLTLEFPNTAYMGARFGVDGRLNVGERIVLGLDLGYRWVINPGQGLGLVRSAEYFPDADVSYALDAGASAGVRFSWGQALVGIDHRRYVFGALQGATLSAAGGTDSYTALWLSARGAFGATR